jgi:hypothetical protein
VGRRKVSFEKIKKTKANHLKIFECVGSTMMNASNFFEYFPNTPPSLAFLHRKISNKSHHEIHPPRGIVPGPPVSRL